MKDLVILFGAGHMIIKLLVKEMFQTLMINPLLEKEELETVLLRLCTAIFLLASLY